MGDENVFWYTFWSRGRAPARFGYGPIYTQKSSVLWNISAIMSAMGMICLVQVETEMVWTISDLAVEPWSWSGRETSSFLCFLKLATIHNDIRNDVDPKEVK